ncbi:MAG: hypothetical protein HYU78_02205 [Rhodocyclales bacterium]|nr:hypothetical protein [Rhodocyclales bacterium]
MNPTALLALAVAWGISAAGAAWIGWDYRDGKAAQQQLAVAQAYADWAEQARTKADTLAADLSAARTAQAPKERLITKEITRYVQVTPAADRCTLPGTWRVRHDAAATGVPLGPESGPVALGAGGPVEDAAALDTIGDNYAAARECFAKLAGWQRRYREVERGPRP